MTNLVVYPPYQLSILMAVDLLKDSNPSAEFAMLDDDEQLRHEKLMEDHDLDTAPLVTRGAYEAGKYSGRNFQYGLLGQLILIRSKTSAIMPEDPRLYINTNAPFSALVCGVQGSGKSHTVSVMLESMLVPNCPSAGRLEKALSGLVFHFSEGGTNSLPSEAAWLAVPGQKVAALPVVRVFVSRSSLNTMRTVYQPLGDRVTVEPLIFSESDLDAQAFLSMMAIGTSESMPLYMQIVLTILRGLGENYTFRAFKEQLELQKKSFNPAQLSGIEQRMSLLMSFLETNSQTLFRKKKRRSSLFAAGQLTIIDLSDPFIDPASACGVFEIIARQFVRADLDTGKFLIVDEAHKYLSAARASGLTNTLLSLIRQQRHLSMRIIISTQEPTAVPSTLLELCNLILLHRFSSPSWWDHIMKHVSADFSNTDVFDQVVRLGTGEALVIAPSALGIFGNNTGSPASIKHLGRSYLVIKTRKRLTYDGGASRLVLATK